MTLKRKEMKLTKHFVERYHERILDKDNISWSRVHIDLNHRLTLYEKESIKLFANKNIDYVKIPLGMINTMVIKNGSFITVY